MSSPANLVKLAKDGATVLASALADASEAGVVSLMVADAAVIKDALEQLVLLVPPIDAAALKPAERAAADAAAQAAEDAKFPTT